MKQINILAAVAIAAAGLGAAIDVQAQAKHGWRGGHGHPGYGHRWHGPRLGLYIGAPILFGSYYWNSPWYDEPRVIYREVLREPETIESYREPATSELPREGAPAQGPLYMNYCESSRAYYPKATSCPEGWKFITPTQ